MVDEEAAVISKFLQLYYARGVSTWQDTSWLGVKLYKSPLDLWVYQELIWKLNPGLIVECGTAAGGSGLFFASLCDLMGRGQVMSIDVKEQDERPSHPRLHYITGSSTAEDTLNSVKDAAEYAGHVLVVLDSDHTYQHVLDEMRLYAEIVTPGSYLIVEDGIVNGNPVLPDFGPGPREAIAQFLSERCDFDVDIDCEKFLMTFNPHGFLKKKLHVAG